MSVFASLEFPTQFRAVGVIKGSYDSTQGAEGIFTFGRSKVQASLGQRLRGKVNKNPGLLESIAEQKMFWTVYPRTEENGRLDHVQLINYQEDESFIEGASSFQIRGVVAALTPTTIGVKIKRNLKKRKPFNIFLTGKLPDVEPQQFWEFQAVLQGTKLKYKSGQCIADEYDPEQQPSLKEILEYEPVELVTVPSNTPIMRVKFNRIQRLPEQGKKMRLVIREENGSVIRADVGRKSMKKQVERMETYPYWIASLGGKVANITEKGVVELENAGVTVFEKKPKKQEGGKEDE